MERLDVRTACFFVIGLLFLTFGCHGAHFSGLGHGLGHIGHGFGGHALGGIGSGVGHVAATPHVGPVGGGLTGVVRGGVVPVKAEPGAVEHALADVGRSIAITASRSRAVVIAEGGHPPPDCDHVCPTTVNGAPGYVCATPLSAYDPSTQRMQPVYMCVPPRGDSR
jgi:hypothetical protein